MFVKIFVFAFVVAYVVAEIPSYIHACSRNNPNYNQCVMDNINNVKDKICKGFPEFDIPPNEPLLFESVVFDEDNLKLHLKQAKVYGFCNFVINSVDTDSEKLHFNINILYPRLHINTTYDFAIRLLVPIAHQGLLEAVSENIIMKVGLDLKVITKNHKKHIFASKVNVNLSIKSFEYKFDQSKKELTQLYQILNDSLKNNQQDIIRIVKPEIEKEASRAIISIFNGITRSNYKELFP
ncbi:uncharacterized protein LOC105423219 [Pogonomyrmex barbatus]|uniref:Uncharacterized protein LOC105423219 n=1 Tax=Pogonomyrmex barbatus TaxID=144034 RepID=A0A6I9VYU2_9HYME|nr:uncharacterized protein LOC105423219 [Pogonomyrmex barbatus]